MLWQLWRQDDNGIKYLVGTYATKEAADNKIVELTKCHHKQTYWVSKTTGILTGAEP